MFPIVALSACVITMPAQLISSVCFTGIAALCGPNPAGIVILELFVQFAVVMLDCAMRSNFLQQLQMQRGQAQARANEVLDRPDFWIVPNPNPNPGYYFTGIVLLRNQPLRQGDSLLRNYLLTPSPFALQRVMHNSLHWCDTLERRFPFFLTSRCPYHSPVGDVVGTLFQSCNPHRRTYRLSSKSYTRQWR